MRTVSDMLATIGPGVVFDEEHEEHAHRCSTKNMKNMHIGVEQFCSIQGGIRHVRTPLFIVSSGSP